MFLDGENVRILCQSSACGRIQADHVTSLYMSKHHQVSGGACGAPTVKPPTRSQLTS